MTLINVFNRLFVSACMCLFLLLICSCGNNGNYNNISTDASGITGRDTAMPPESTNVVGHRTDLPASQTQKAVSDSPGVKMTVRRGEVKLYDTVKH